MSQGHGDPTYREKQYEAARLNPRQAIELGIRFRREMNLASNQNYVDSLDMALGQIPTEEPLGD